MHRFFLLTYSFTQNDRRLLSSQLKASSCGGLDTVWVDWNLITINYFITKTSDAKSVTSNHPRVWARNLSPHFQWPVEDNCLYCWAFRVRRLQFIKRGPGFSAEHGRERWNAKSKPDGLQVRTSRSSKAKFWVPRSSNCWQGRATAPPSELGALLPQVSTKIFLNFLQQWNSWEIGRLGPSRHWDPF